MKVINTLAVLSILLSSAFSGCESTKPAASSNSLCGSSLNMNAALEGIQGTWVLKGHGNAGMAMADCAPGAVKEMTLEFKGEGLVQGTSACNSITGNYTATGGRLQLSGLAYTEMLCGESEGLIMTWDNRFIKGIEGAASYEVTGNALHLKTNNGNDLFLLKK